MRKPKGWETFGDVGPIQNETFDWLFIRSKQGVPPQSKITSDNNSVAYIFAYQY